ncbi:hypothetical protein [Konateibacter massiliensis]|uniref:hypothetical protein n=1 Tax=Konateibacter massiliensis TaxID=2002841 RepID=UPI000C15BD59|nr:hypothetical protein [Konateibacter massiliensis]
MSGIKFKSVPKHANIIHETPIIEIDGVELHGCVTNKDDDEILKVKVSKWSDMVHIANAHTDA